MPIPQDILKSIKDGSFKEEFLDLSNNNISDPEIIEFSNHLRKNLYVKIINLSGNNIRNKGATALAEIFLEELILRGNAIGPTGAINLAASNLKKLDISTNPIGDRGMKGLASSKNLEELIAQDCQITDEGSLWILGSKIIKLDLSSTRSTKQILTNFPSEEPSMLNQYKEAKKRKHNINDIENSLSPKKSKLFSATNTKNILKPKND